MTAQKFMDMFTEFRNMGGIFETDYMSYTVAYVPELRGNPRKGLVNASFAWCNPRDEFDETFGQMLALERFMAGESTMLPRAAVDYVGFVYGG